jgi:hypothetical protein
MEKMERIESTLLIVHEIVDWYNGLPEDFVGINELIHKRRILATNLFYLTTEIGWLGQEVETKKRSFDQQFDDCVTKHMNENPKWKAESLAKSESHAWSEEMNELKAIYTRLKGQEKSIYEILNAMQQDIAVIRKELESTKGFQ